MSLDETTQERRQRLRAEIKHLLKEIEWKLALLVSGADELEAIEAEADGRVAESVYAEISEQTGWGIALMSEPFRIPTSTLPPGGRQQMPLLEAWGLVERID